ncbi:hypothetical protein EUGRSUZ_L01106 [Eucalyptus grandis]|uniref:Lipid desaturase domain-containing protein n=1 Tax=Eucalyptus grandis TaxID=71139 RepID=A0A058ZUW5_EUCGR|nr:hypothetical protein EUGRSUZ_L01106 [Eucalyptus grandis]
MSIAFHHKLFHSSVLHERAHVPRGRVYCLAATTVKPRPDPTGLAVEPRLLTALAPLMCTAVLVALAKSVVASCESHVWAEPILAGAVGYVLADLGSGVYHWGIDNYGDASTPVFGTQIEAFQGHHKWPWTITRRQGANNLHALACAVVFVVGPIDFICKDPTMLGFVAVCSGCIMFSQQFHSWAQSTKSKLPPLVFLDDRKVFEALEMVLFFKFGLRPRSWSEPSSKRTGDVEGEDLYQLEA